MRAYCATGVRFILEELPERERSWDLLKQGGSVAAGAPALVLFPPPCYNQPDSGRAGACGKRSPWAGRNEMGPDPVRQGEAMKHYSAVCFDFDYTLGDSTDSIVAGFQYGFTRLGWPAPDRETVRRTVGYLLEDAYTLLTGDRDPEHRAAFRPLFLEASMERQRRETTLFPGARSCSGAEARGSGWGP